MAACRKGCGVEYADMVKGFINHLRAGKLSEASITLRRYYIDRARADGVDLLGASTMELEAWLSGQDWSTETARSARSSLVSFYGWLTVAGLRSDNPAIVLPTISEIAPCPRPLPEADYRRAVASAGTVDRLAIRLAGEAGLRRAEVAQIHGRDVISDLLGVSVLVHGKGGKDRLVPLNESVARELQRAVDASGAWAFPSPVTASHLTAGVIGKRVSGWLPAGYSMHSLRHRFATVAYSGSSDIRAVQELLGHMSLATTQRYVATNAARLREVANLAA